MPSEIALIVFFTAFAVDEFSSMKDSGVTFYAADFWSWLDMFIILIGVIFLGFRIYGPDDCCYLYSTNVFQVYPEW